MRSETLSADWSDLYSSATSANDFPLTAFVQLKVIRYRYTRRRPNKILSDMGIPKLKKGYEKRLRLLSKRGRE